MSENIQPINISALMEKYQLKPQKSLGQNFLVDPQALQRIVEVADLDPASVVLEIGAGLGHLTRYLAAKAKRVIALEVDKNLIPPLREVLQPYPRVRIVHGDILQLTPGELIDQDNYLVVANIPYYITSKIIRNLLEAENKPQRMVLTVQYEVAQRICAAAGDMSILALSVQVYGEPYLTSADTGCRFSPSTPGGLRQHPDRYLSPSAAFKIGQGGLFQTDQSRVQAQKKNPAEFSVGRIRLEKRPHRNPA